MTPAERYRKNGTWIEPGDKYRPFDSRIKVLCPDGVTRVGEADYFADKANGAAVNVWDPELGTVPGYTLLDEDTFRFYSVEVGRFKDAFRGWA